MGIETQVTCKELSEELRDNGYRQEGVWWWHIRTITDVLKRKNSPINVLTQNKELLKYDWLKDEAFVAPTVAELGEALAECDEDWYSEPYAGIWYCRIHTHGVKDSCTRRIEADTEANCRAKMWIYLKKNGLIK